VFRLGEMPVAAKAALLSRIEGARTSAGPSPERRPVSAVAESTRARAGA
jgi:hypothetical protein